MEKMGVKQGRGVKRLFSSRKDCVRRRGWEGVTKVLFCPTLAHVLSQMSPTPPPIATN
jgi:hypothetical protein